jgi:riboflavin kinase/FMN adenylyltransferase
MKDIMKRMEDGTCVALDRFEGMHRGHEKELKQLLWEARARNLSPVMLSVYDPGAQALTTEAEKAEYARVLGVEDVRSLTWDVLFMDGKAFAKKILREKLRAKTLITPFDELAEEVKNAGLEFFAPERVMLDGAPVTTERLEQAFAAHDFPEYRRLCARPYTMTGTIVHGKGLGRTVGMPTANMAIAPGKRMPAEGVYATVMQLGGARYMGLTNIGRRPSVDADGRFTVETHLLDFEKDVYGEEARLEIHFFVRGVRKFESLRAVQKQVSEDERVSRERLKGETDD